MWIANSKNHSFDRMGEEWAPLIDPDHFLGRSAFDIPYPKQKGQPEANLVGNGHLFTLKVSLPDYEREDLTVKIKNDLLFVSGQKEQKVVHDTSAFVPTELQRESFERVFMLAATIAREGVSAHLIDGVLHIKFVDVPTEEETKHRNIEIQ